MTTDAPIFGDERLPERFWEKVQAAPDGCWTWQGARIWSGYGQMRVGAKAVSVHRLAYAALVGEIPAGLVIDHLCRERSCVNPAHMEPVTQRENVLRGDSPVGLGARKTHCSKGHEFSPENSYRDDKGKRVCRPCKRAKYRKYQTRRVRRAT